MKTTIGIIVAAMAAYLGYVFWLNDFRPSRPPVTIAQTAPAPLSPPPSEPAVTPPPEPTRTPKTAVFTLAGFTTPQPKHLAAEGVYYLTEAVSATTDSGVMDLPPGTQVRRLGDDAGLIVVQCRDGTKFRASAEELTNDLDVAARVASTYADQQRNLNRFQLQQAASYQSRQQQQSQLSAKPSVNANANATRDSRIAQIQKKIASHRAAIQRIEREIGNAPPGSRAYVGRDLQALMDQHQNQINALQQELDTLGVSGVFQ